MILMQLHLPGFELDGLWYIRRQVGEEVFFLHRDGAWRKRSSVTEDDRIVYSGLYNTRDDALAMLVNYKSGSGVTNNA